MLLSFSSLCSGGRLDLPLYSFLLGACCVHVPISSPRGDDLKMLLCCVAVFFMLLLPPRVCLDNRCNNKRVYKSAMSRLERTSQAACTTFAVQTFKTFPHKTFLIRCANQYSDIGLHGSFGIDSMGICVPVAGDVLHHSC